MKRLVRSAEALHVLIFALGLAAPLALFFWRVAPWSVDVKAVLTDPAIVTAMRNSLVLASVTSIISTSLAFVFCWLLWRYRWPTRLSGAISLTLKIPYLIPPFFFAIGWIALAAPEVGYLNKLLVDLGFSQLPTIYGMGGTIFVFVLWAVALAMIQLQVFFAQLPGQFEDAAIMCGASPFKAFLSITLPLARTRLLACALLTAVNALAAFGVPAMLGAPARTYVFTTRIYQSIKSSQNFAQAGLLSLVLLSITILLLVLQRLAGSRQTARILSGKVARPSPLEPTLFARLGMGAAAAFAVLASVLPCGAVTMQSLLRDRSDVTSWTIDKYVAVFTQVPDVGLAIGNSLSSALAASAAAAFLGLILAHGAARQHSRLSRVLVEIWDVGYALPGTVIALCLIVFYAGTLTDTIWILMIAYFVKYAAFALRTLTPAMASLSNELEEAGWMSGASPLKVFARLLVPMLKPALAAALLLAFVPMVSELTMSVLLAGAGTTTLGTLIYRLQEYADPGSAAVLAVMVAVATLALNAVVKRFSKGSFGI